MMAGKESLPFVLPDAPLWRPELAVRKNPYRYLEHQKGTIGMLNIRLIDGRDLDRGLDASGSGKASGTVSPQVLIRVAEEEVRSSVASRNAHPSWRERYSVPLRKGVLQEGAPVLVIFQVVDASSMWKSTLGAKGKELGTGSLDILALLNGSRGSHVMDDWVELSPGGGALHVVVEYEPVGMEPEKDDVVFFEAFARSPRSLVFPHNEPMVVRDVSGAYLLVGFQTPAAREAMAYSPADEAHENRVKVHRQTVFVVERRTYLDAVWHMGVDVTEVIGAIPPVQWAKKQVQPYARYVQVLARPALTSLSIAFAAAKLAMRSSMAALGGATSTVFADD